MISPLEWLKNYLGDVTRGLERFCNRFYGTYPARVIDNKDPEGRYRIRATCPAINMPNPEDVPGGFWMRPSMNGMGDTPDGQITGVFHPPEEGSIIWVVFEWGDPQLPIYIGGTITTRQKSETFQSDDMENKGPTKRGIRTRAGHYLVFNDDPDKLEVAIVRGDGEGEPTPQFISFTKEGHTQITNKNGSTLYMNAEDDETTLQTVDKDGKVGSMLFLGVDKVTLMTKSGGAIAINGKDIVLTGDNVVTDCNKQFSASAGVVFLGKGASEPAIKGNAFALGWGLTHQHTTSAPGAPTTPGTTPPVMMYKELSSKVFIS
ncbi:MAG: phage baseplate assembly protein V [Dehalococcoidales bacterium]|nr:phage baseplate assembly protein V [Dehalococcoidales bacterium]